MKRIVFALLVFVLLFATLPATPVQALTPRYVTWRVWIDDDRDGNKDVGENWATNNFSKWSSTFDSSGYGGGVAVKEKWNINDGYVHNSAQNSPAWVTVDPLIPSTLCTYIGGVQQSAFIFFLSEGGGNYELQFGANYCV